MVPPPTDTITLEHQGAGDQPIYRPYSRSKTTYGNMTSWAKPMPSDYNPGARKNWSEQSSSFQKPLRDPSRSDDYYQRYLELSSNVAYRHPHLATPRERQGRIGGSWRHIKEVLGYTGSQVCFVDGLVSLYDKEVRESAVSRGPAWRARLNGPTGYSANLARQSVSRGGMS